MSIRIQGQGTSFSGGGSGKERERSERFRRAHRAGQKVRGTVLEWRAPGLAWVDIDGHGLLAQLATDAALGRERTFLILRLEPDIVLREIRETSGLDTVV
jgi:hypothetical protein